MTKHSHKQAHAHNHSHDHKGHSHEHADVSSADGRRRVAIAGLLTAAFMGAEVVGGLISGSLALLADAAHMLTDAASLALAWFGYKLAARPADETRSFGFSRFRVLAAFTNGIALLALAVWITVEGILRLLDPQPVIGPLLLGVACVGLLVNFVCIAILHGGEQDDLNLRGAFWHVVGDLLGSVAAIGAAIIIIYTGWMPIDPLLSIMVAALVAVAGWRITKQSAHILVQGAPEGITSPALASDIMAHVDGVESVSHIHAWSLTEKQVIVSMEAAAKPGLCPQTMRDAIKARLALTFGITHATIEIKQPPA